MNTGQDVNFLARVVARAPHKRAVDALVKLSVNCVNLTFI